MSQARCTFQVRGLDCPSEVESLRAALRDQPGVTNLGFDLIHGTMTVDFGEGAVEPEQLARLIIRANRAAHDRAGPTRRIGPFMVVGE